MAPLLFRGIGRSALNNKEFVALGNALPRGVELVVQVESLKTGPKKLLEVRAGGRLIHGTAWRDDETVDQAALRLKTALRRKGIL